MSRIQGGLEFSKNWEDEEDFPTKEYNEATVRENIQLLFDETKDYINGTITPAINDNMTRIDNMGGGAGVPHEQLGDNAVWENNIKNLSITEYKYGNSSIPTTAFKNGSITAEKFNTASTNQYVEQRIAAYSDATTSSHGLMSFSDKTKLNGIAAGAEVNQNAFSNVAVGNTTIAADAKTDTLTLVAGANITLTPDATNDKLTIAATNSTYSDVTTSAHGLMTAADKVKLNGIAAGAEVNQNAFSNVTVGSTTISADGKTDTLTLVAGSNVTLTPDATNDKVTIASTNTTYADATTSAHGLMTAADKVKLNGIAAGANAYSLPTATSSTLGGVKVGSNITNSSGTISLTKANVTSALGYTPPTTNTNTWRGVVDNLTSTSTTESLTANQGRVLKGLVDGKAAASHSHTAQTEMVAGDNNITVTTNGAVMSRKSGSTVYAQVGVYGDATTTNRRVVVTGYTLRPASNNATYLGTNDYKWISLFSVNSGSDRRIKKDIDYDMSAYLRAFDNFKPCHFHYIEDTGKEHNGIIAQEAMAALEAEGITDSSIFFTDPGDEKQTLNVEYGQFIGILIAKIQDLQRQVDELKAGDN